jgi:hypothetical protein
VDRAGNGEHLLALLGREPGGDQRARLQRGLHHQRAAREAGNDAVALREVLVERRRAERELAHDQAAGRDAVRQLAVSGRVDAVESRADHGHRRRAARVIGCIERTLVGRAVDAEREPRHHRNSGLAEGPGEGARIRRALRCRIAAADHGDAVSELRQIQCRRAQQVEHQRRVRHLEERGRIAGVAQGEDAPRGTARFGALQPIEGLVELRCEVRRCAQQGLCLCVRHQLPQRRRRLNENVRRETEGREQLARGAIADTRRQREPQPAREFFTFHAKTREKVRD